MKKLLMLLAAVVLFFNSYQVSASVDTSGCVGGTYSVYTTSMGFVAYYTSYDTSIASVDHSTGVVHANAPGTTIIYYFDSPGTLIGLTAFTVHATTYSADSTLSGSVLNVCIGSGISLTPVTMDTTGVWSSSDPLKATVWPSGTGYMHRVGAVGGISAGTVTISYTTTSGLAGCPTIHTEYKQIQVLNPAAVGPINASGSLCEGGSVTLSDSAAGGVWTLSDTTHIHLGPPGPYYCMATAISIGTAIVTYTKSFTCGGMMSSASASYLLTVNAVPDAGIISGPSALCLGESGMLSSTGTVTSWSQLAGSSSFSFGSPAGTITAVSGTGINAIIGVDTNMCGVDTSLFYVTVNALPDAGVISGPHYVCDGWYDTLTSTTPGVNWGYAPGGTGVAGDNLIVNPLTGAATTIITGSDMIIATISNSCGTDTAYHMTTVYNADYLMPFTAPATMATGTSITLADAVPGGLWGVTPSSVAAIDPFTGELTALAPGTAIVTYGTSIGCPFTSYASDTIEVNIADGIQGRINFAGDPYTGDIKVWLIKYVAPMLSAVDSMVVTSTGSDALYYFSGVPSDNYRIKAAPLDVPVGGTGYIPTYHTSDFYWNTATVLSHTSGTADLGQDINVMTGMVTAGPGFIAGDVTTGANKGTTGGVPVNDLMMYLFNSAGTLIQSARTDATGHYSFSYLPTDVYYVFPDSLNYATTPYNSITLTSGSPAFTAASFIQHTLSKTITPIPVSVSNVTAADASVVTFPNPTTGKVSIVWQMASTEEATVVVTDVVGKVVFNGNINMTQGAGSSQLNLSTLCSGVYNLAVKSASINYNNKIQVQH